MALTWISQGGGAGQKKVMGFDGPDSAGDGDLVFADFGEDTGLKAIPGYTGHLPGADHISGQTYGATQGLTKPGRREVYFSTLPNIHRDETKADKRIPGYTGFIQGVSEKYGTTYGEITAQSLTAYENPRVANNAGRDYIAHSHRKKYSWIQSGGSRQDNDTDRLKKSPWEKKKDARQSRGNGQSLIRPKAVGGYSGFIPHGVENDHLTFPQKIGGTIPGYTGCRKPGTLAEISH